MGTARADSVAIYSMKHMEQICSILVLKGTDYDSEMQPSDKGEANP